MISNNIVKELKNSGMSSALGYTFYYHNSRLTVYKDGTTKNITVHNLCAEAIEWSIAKHVVSAQLKPHALPSYESCSM